MITVTVLILAVLFAAGSITPLLISDDVNDVVDLHTSVAEEQ